MIRFANPQSDPIALRNLFRSAILAPLDDGAESVNFDSIAARAAAGGTLTSSGTVGDAAIRQSFVNDRSRDGAYNQAKALTEAYRMFGWLRSLPGDRGRFEPTPLGRQFASFEGARFGRGGNAETDEIALWQRLLAMLVVPAGSIETRDARSQRPLLNLLRVARAVGGTLLVNEMVGTVFQADDDRRIGYIDELAGRIAEWRSPGGHERLDAAVDAMLGERGITLISARNYLRLPLRLVKDVGWFEDVTYSELSAADQAEFAIELGEQRARRRSYFRLTASGRSSLERFEQMRDLRADDVPPQVRPALSALVYATRRRLDTTPELEMALRPATEFLRCLLSEQFSGELLLEPFQQFGVEDLLEAEALASKLDPNPFAPLPARTQNTVAYLAFTAESMGPIAVEARLGGPATLRYDQVEAVSSCACCVPAPCVAYRDDEVALPAERRGMPAADPHLLCPTDAITIDPVSGQATIDADACVACGVCASRCPIGAIWYDTPAFRVSHGPALPRTELRQGELHEAAAMTAGWHARTKTTAFDPEWPLAASLQVTFHERARTCHNKAQFYPLVRNLLRELGLAVALGRSGDVNWRFDGLVYHPFVATIEMKSPGESRRISVSSTRQAVENAAVAMSRFKLSANPANAVVGYEYPSDRSDVRQALVDTREALGVSVVIFTTVALSALLLLHRVLRFDGSDLRELFYAEPGPVSQERLDRALRAYFARRLEWFVGAGQEGTSPSMPLGVSRADGEEQLLQLWRACSRFVRDLVPVIGSE